MIRVLLPLLMLCAASCAKEALYAVPEEPVGYDIPNPPPVEEPPPEESTPPTTEPPPPEEEEEPPTVPDDPAPVDDCEGIADLVYVIDRGEEALYLFDPESGAFTFHGELDCAIFAGQPSSMSVARNGFAYVRYSAGDVYAVDLETMTCTETAYDEDFGAFGMGYATENASTWQDHLYIANADQLARLDTDSWELTAIGGIPSQSELTGNSAGELWAILPLESPAQLVHLNKENAQIQNTIYISQFPDPYGIDTFAFATWGGDFWLFVRSYGFGNTTDVYRVEPDGTFAMFEEDTGMDVVGAGVSTCASED